MNGRFELIDRRETMDIDFRENSRAGFVALTQRKQHLTVAEAGEKMLPSVRTNTDSYVDFLGNKADAAGILVPASLFFTGCSPGSALFNGRPRREQCLPLAPAPLVWSFNEPVAHASSLF